MIPSVVVAAALYQLIIKLALEFRKEQLYQIIAVSSTYVICNPCTVQTLTIKALFGLPVVLLAHISREKNL